MSGRDVRLKKSNAFTWLPAGPSEDISMLDAVFTGSSSTAEIRLNNGSLLRIKENSLVKLNSSGKDINLDLKFGDLSTELSGKGLKVSSNGEMIDVKGSGKVSLRRTQSGRIEVSVLDGQAQIQSSKGQHQIQKGETLDIGQQGITSIKTEKITPINASGSNYLKIRSTDPLIIQWQSLPSASYYEWELCDSDTCSQLLQKIKNNRPFARSRDALAEASYHWRVKAFDRKGRQVGASDIHNFQLIIAQPPTITTLPEEALIEKKVRVRNLTEEPKASSRISWTDPYQFEKYEFQFATDPEFGSIIYRGSIATQSSPTPELSSGTYYYQVRSVNPQGRSTDWSQPAQMTFNLDRDLGDIPGRMVFEKSNYDLDLTQIASRSPSSVPPEKVSWAPAANAASYRLELARTPEFKSVKMIETKSRSLTWEQLAPGAWYIRGRALSKEGQAGPLSEATKLSIMAARPVLEPFTRLSKTSNSAEETAPSVEAKARWTNVPSARAYLLQISDKSTFEEPRQLLTREPASAIKIDQPGTYFIRVQGVDEDGTPLSQFSEAEKLEYQFIHPLHPPELLEPENKSEIFLQSIEQPMLWLEWKGVQEASSYQIEISLDPNFSRVIFRTEDSKTRVLLQNRIPRGLFYWRVRARIAQTSRTSDWSEIRTFRIDSHSLRGFNL